VVSRMLPAVASCSMRACQMRLSGLQRSIHVQSLRSPHHDSPALRPTRIVAPGRDLDPEPPAAPGPRHPGHDEPCRYEGTVNQVLGDAIMPCWRSHAMRITPAAVTAACHAGRMRELTEEVAPQSGLEATHSGGP